MMAHNLTPAMIVSRIAKERELEAALIVERLVGRGARVMAEGRGCKHAWEVDLQRFMDAGLATLSLRWEDLPCPTCGVVSWPLFTVHG